jgi:hypothetical protein
MDKGRNMLETVSTNAAIPWPYFVKRFSNVPLTWHALGMSCAYRLHKQTLTVRHLHTVCIALQSNISVSVSV